LCSVSNICYQGYSLTLLRIDLGDDFLKNLAPSGK
jgi:hypothetical protein